MLLIVLKILLTNLKHEDEDVGKFNDILVQVAAVVIYGFSQPSPDDAAPINGFEPEVIAQAAVLVLLTFIFLNFTSLILIQSQIMQALQECVGSSTSFQHLPHSPMPCVPTKQDTLSRFESMARTRPVVWRQLGMEILEHKFSLEMRGGTRKLHFLIAAA